MKSLYMWCARRGSNSDEWMSTHTEGCFLLKSSGSSVYGIKWNHMSFIARSSRLGPVVHERSFTDFWLSMRGFCAAQYYCVCATFLFANRILCIATSRTQQ